VERHNLVRQDFPATNGLVQQLSKMVILCNEPISFTLSLGKLPGQLEDPLSGLAHQLGLARRKALQSTCILKCKLETRIRCHRHLLASQVLGRAP
jgi:hypothetical protein